MKKIFNILLLSAIAFGTFSCEKDDIGGTATESMAGEWYCTVDACDEAGNLLYEDPYGMGSQVHFDTFNTASNVADEMYICDGGNFWEFQVKVSIDQATKTFSAENATDIINGCEIDVTDGEIVYDGATSPTGKPADAISFKITFSDDDNGLIYLVHGYRICGFE